MVGRLGNAASSEKSKSKMSLWTSAVEFHAEYRKLHSLHKNIDVTMGVGSISKNFERQPERNGGMCVQASELGRRIERLILREQPNQTFLAVLPRA